MVAVAFSRYLPSHIVHNMLQLRADQFGDQAVSGLMGMRR